MLALIADDDPLNRDLLRRMLARLGWTVEDVPDGESAVAACARTAYDLVLLDLRMGGMGGAETAARIRTAFASSGDPARCPPRILAVTGSDDMTGTERSAFDGLLQKPFSFAELSGLARPPEP